MKNKIAKVQFKMTNEELNSFSMTIERDLKKLLNHIRNNQYDTSMDLNFKRNVANGEIIINFYECVDNYTMLSTLNRFRESLVSYCKCDSYDYGLSTIVNIEINFMYGDGFKNFIEGSKLKDMLTQEKMLIAKREEDFKLFYSNLEIGLEKMFKSKKLEINIHSGDLLVFLNRKLIYKQEGVLEHNHIITKSGVDMYDPFKRKKVIDLYVE